MPKTDSKRFKCQSCNFESLQWMGFCPTCGDGNSLIEVAISDVSSKPWLLGSEQEMVELKHVSIDNTPRLELPLPEVNRVLGGGIVPGSLILLAGDPGIGKSTFLLRIADYISRIGSVVYISGEESAEQVKIRANRLHISGSKLYFLGVTDIEEILGCIDKMKPLCVVVDSIQTISSKTLPSSPGSIIQVKESTRLIMEWAKVNNVCVILSGHVTKEGELAGPRVLEHMVDVVMYLEGDRQSDLRVLRGTKNRFGSTNEVALLRMEDQGLIEVSDPSQHLLAERQNGAHGSAIVPVLEGSRPLLVEIQALSIPSNLPAPRKVANGVDQSRLIMLTAVLSKHSGIRLPFNQDIFVNAAGGLRIAETAADLAMLLAIASSIKEKPLIPDLIVVGEVGLGGELRSVPQLQIRLNEAKRLGFKKCLLPKSSKDSVGNIKGIEKLMASNLSQAINLGIYGKSK